MLSEGLPACRTRSEVPMRRLILGIVILAVPAYAQGQKQDDSGSSRGRTAVPREQGIQAAPARHERHAEPRGERSAGRRRGGESDAAAESHARASAPLNPGFRTSLNPGFQTTLNPGFLTALNPGFRQPQDRDERLRRHEGDYRPPYRRSHSAGNVLFVPYATPVVIERQIVVERVADDTPLAPVIIEQPSLARLILDVHPPTAQIFADGYYIGIPEDFRVEDGGAALEPGPHRIDILARDYEPVRFNVNLTRGQSATYRHSLSPIARSPEPAPAAVVNLPPAVKPPATFYLIPGCYMGNVPPKEANLPATCDAARVVTFQY